MAAGAADDAVHPRHGDEVEDDIDDDWDWDTELGLLEPWAEEHVHHPWIPTGVRVTPPRERDERVAVVGAGGGGEFIRACRATAGLSQRELAEKAGVPQSTVARIESGRSSGVQVATVCRLVEACGVVLVGAVGPDLDLVHTDAAQRHRDAEGRLLPAHLVNRPLPAWHGAWWGDDRYTHRRPRPRRTFVRRSRFPDPPSDPATGPSAASSG